MLISHICISAYLSSLLKSRFFFAERDSAISNHQIQMMWAFWEEKNAKTNRGGGRRYAHNDRSSVSFLTAMKAQESFKNLLRKRKEKEK